MRITRLAAAIALLGPWLCGAASAADTLKATIDRLGGQPCRVGSLTCVSVEVPVDYRANTGPKIKIEYSVSFASGESKGILFYVVGGPGGSGIGVADDYLAAFDERLTRARSSWRSSRSSRPTRRSPARKNLPPTAPPS
jgi:hypothetical protein